MLKKRIAGDEKGSLALEQVLFIMAVVLIAGGLFAFYRSMGDYFTDFSDNLGTAPSFPDPSGSQQQGS